jgi:hypothetical protein
MVELGRSGQLDTEPFVVDGELPNRNPYVCLAGYHNERRDGMMPLWEKLFIGVSFLALFWFLILSRLISHLLHDLHLH